MHSLKEGSRVWGVEGTHPTGETESRTGYRVTDKNVIKELFVGREGIYGVTSRSGYCIEDDYVKAKQIAREYNQGQGE